MPFGGVRLSTRRRALTPSHAALNPSRVALMPLLCWKAGTAHNFKVGKHTLELDRHPLSPSACSPRWLRRGGLDAAECLCIRALATLGQLQD